MSRALYLVRVRGGGPEPALERAGSFIAGVSLHQEAKVLGMISFGPRELRAQSARGRRLLAPLRSELEVLKLAKRMRFDHQLELLEGRVGRRAVAEARERYLRRIGPGGEGALFRKLISPLKPEDLSIELRRQIYECFVAYAQNTTPRTFPFASVGAHFESCRLFDLGGRGKARYVLAEAEPADHSHEH